MVKQRKKQKRASPAHAQEDRIEFNGPNLGEPADGVSGNPGGNMDDSAGVPDGSMDVSGDVSSVNQTPAKSSTKKSAKSRAKSTHSRRGEVSRVLVGEFDSVEGLLDGSRSASAENNDSTGDESQPGSGQLPPVYDDSGNLVDLAQLDVQSEAGKAFVLRYLTSEGVVNWMARHDSSAALQTMIDGVRGDSPPRRSEKTPSPKKRNVGAPAEAAPSPKAQRKRVVPNSGSFAEMGNQYRLGDSGAIGELAARQKKNVQHVTRTLAANAAGAAPQTPVGCMTLDQHDVNELTRTVQKVLLRRADLSSLPRKVRLRKVVQMAARELHKAELAALSPPPVVGEKPPPTVREKPASVASDGDSESVGDTVGSKSSRSGSDSESDSDSITRFVINDSVTDEDDEDDSDSDTDDSDAESKGQREKRLRNRKGAMNGFGTPSAKRRAIVVPPVPATAHAPAASAPPGLMVFGNDDLKMWTIGTAAYKQGLNWEAYVHHKQAYDNYMQHKGKWSDRTFKSVIDAKLVPALCAVCGFKRGKWHTIDDARLILKLERALSYSRSTDFAVELRAIHLLKRKHAGESLMSRYEVYAEKFIYKCAEAEDAGKPIKPNVIKQAYKSEVEREKVLKHWLQEVQWKGVERAHKRLLRKLREARSIEQLFNSEDRGGRRDRDDASEGSDGGGSNGGGNNGGGGGNGGGRGGGGRGASRRGSGFKSRRINSGKRRTGKGKANSFNGGGGDGKVAGKGDKGPKLRTWSYDKRGPSWHTDHDLYDCYDKPCKRPFCQRCRQHGHTAEYCRKADDVPGLTREGYAQDNAKGKAALQAPPPMRTGKSNRAKGSRSAGNSSSDDEDGDSHRSERAETRSRHNNSGGRKDKSSQSRGSSDDEGEDAARGGSRGRNCL